MSYLPDYDRYYDNYKVANVIWGVKANGKVVNNRISDAGISSQELSDAIAIATKKYVSRVEPKVQPVKTALEVAKEEAKKSGNTYTQSVTINVANEMPPTIIETPEQLEDYIKKLRERLMVKLAKNQKIFLN